MATSKLKEPWELYPAIWKTKAAFFSYLRSGIRRIWSQYPAKLEWKKSQMQEPPEGYTGRAKKLGQCHYCNEFFAASNLEVDHVEQAGSCNSWETAQNFLKSLLDCDNNWVLACKPCHKVKSHAEKKGLDFMDALADKRAIAFLKGKKAEQVIEYLRAKGCPPERLKTAATRRNVLVELFKKETKWKAGKK